MDAVNAMHALYRSRRKKIRSANPGHPEHKPRRIAAGVLNKSDDQAMMNAIDAEIVASGFDPMSMQLSQLGKYVDDMRECVWKHTHN